MFILENISYIQNCFLHSCLPAFVIYIYNATFDHCDSQMFVKKEVLTGCYDYILVSSCIWIENICMFLGD